MNAPDCILAAAVREHIRVRGAVQGVGFRPFVYRLARDMDLQGCVYNDAEGVTIEVQGDADRLGEFAARLVRQMPPLARIDTLERAVRPAQSDASDFVIASSRGGRVNTSITPDAAICPACLAEICDPADHRYRYAFTNCTDCGPRYTITHALPYDRPNTSMARFTQCRRCQGEYDDPGDRRFHAQPNACPDCGPRLWLTGKDGTTEDEGDVVKAAVSRIARGDVLAVKGLGGFHLVCDARNASAVARLRRAKNREQKPFAVMFANAASIAVFARLDAPARQLLEARERPIVLLDKTPGCDALLDGVAPGMSQLGVMLPHTPLHYLLFLEASGAAGGTSWLEQSQVLVLVMTSANPGGEPLVTANAEALQRLDGIADVFVMHDRDICVRCDDSVVRVLDLGSIIEDRGRPGAAPESIPAACPTHFIRRARGYTPQPVRLAAGGPSVLACGAWLKNTACLTRGAEAFLSQHIGDLENAASCEALEFAVAHLSAVLEIEPVACVHDLHPHFFSTHFALRYAAEHGIPAIGVQHHHAHIAAVAAEHGLTAPVLGVALDGVGLGSDGRAWGGELLRVDGTTFRRLGHLRELRLAGGDRAAREPWRMAASVLFELGRGSEIPRRFAHRAAPIIADMLARGLNSPPTSSAGRWFDAAAGLLGVRDFSTFEGQAAMELEALAREHGPVAAARDGFHISADGTLDLLPLMDRIADAGVPGRSAALFHSTLAAALAEWVVAAARRESVKDVVLGGGCFMNGLLSDALRRALRGAGLAVYEARQVPANDGGLSLGQAWVALQMEMKNVSGDPGKDH